MGFRILSFQAQGPWSFCHRFCFSHDSPELLCSLFFPLTPPLPFLISTILTNAVFWIRGLHISLLPGHRHSASGSNPSPELYPPTPALLPGSPAPLWYHHPPTCSSWKLEILLDSSPSSPPHPTAKPQQVLLVFMNTSGFKDPLPAHRPL